ncbi:MAG: PAS domain S-box protein [Planctomycetes bacterium]|nr:PAS domain S-box protein [Planctomycetota bacterium]
MCAPQAAIIILTSTDDEKLAIRAVREGAQDYLVKGQLDVRTLIRALTHAVERKHAEEALRESEEKYRILVDNANDAILMAQDDVIKFANRAAIRLTGYSADELAKNHMTQIIHPEDRNMVYDCYERRLRGESVQNTYTFRVINKSGEEFWVETNAALITWEGRPASLTFLRDISRQEKLKDQLNHAQKMEAIGTLAGGCAHDFNNILASIIGFSELGLISMPESMPERNYLEQVLKAGKRAKDLVKHILTFCRKSQDAKKPLQLSLVIKEALKLLRASLPSTIQIQRRIDNKPTLVMADPTQMHQVLMNLCSNAAHAMRKKGGMLDVILEEVNLSEDDVTGLPGLDPVRHLRLTVRDTGHGIEPRHLARIFEPYFTTKPPGEGTGMGLAMVHGIVHDHGGTITVESTKGKGTAFHVYLPVTEGDEAKIPEIPKPIPAGSGRILFVDDEPSLIEIGKRTLERIGYDVIATTSSIEALETFRKENETIDAVITDQTMPILTGIELAEKLFQIRSDLPVILCTGFSELVDEKLAREMGLRAYLRKPVIAHDLANTLRQVLNSEKPVFVSSSL